MKLPYNSDFYEIVGYAAILTKSSRECLWGTECESETPVGLVLYGLERNLNYKWVFHTSGGNYTVKCFKKGVCLLSECLGSKERTISLIREIADDVGLFPNSMNYATTRVAASIYDFEEPYLKVLEPLSDNVGNLPISTDAVYSYFDYQSGKVSEDNWTAHVELCSSLHSLILKHCKQE